MYGCDESLTVTSDAVMNSPLPRYPLTDEYHFTDTGSPSGSDALADMDTTARNASRSGSKAATCDDRFPGDVIVTVGGLFSDGGGGVVIDGVVGELDVGELVVGELDVGELDVGELDVGELDVLVSGRVVSIDVVAGAPRAVEDTPAGTVVAVEDGATAVTTVELEPAVASLPVPASDALQAAAATAITSTARLLCISRDFVATNMVLNLLVGRERYLNIRGTGYGPT